MNLVSFAKCIDLSSSLPFVDSWNRSHAGVCWQIITGDAREYAHCFVVFCLCYSSWWIEIHCLPITFRVTSRIPWQLYDCIGAIVIVPVSVKLPGNMCSISTETTRYNQSCAYIKLTGTKITRQWIMHIFIHICSISAVFMQWWCDRLVLYNRSVSVNCICVRIRLSVFEVICSTKDIWIVQIHTLVNICSVWSGAVFHSACNLRNIF